MLHVLRFVIVIAIISVLSLCTVAYALGFDNSFESMVIEKQKEYPSWYIGKGISPGESFTYHICDRTIKPTLNGATTCYQAKLDFVSLLQDDTGWSWIVQGTFTPDGSTNQWPAILRITEDFGTITTDGSSMNYATSLSHTLLYLQKYANTFKPQTLEIGSSWGFVDDYVSPVPQLTVTRFTSIDTASNSTGVYEIGFDVVKDNTIYIKDGFPFPIEQTIYDSKVYNSDPPILYQLKLETNNAQANNGISQGIGIMALCSNPLLYAQAPNYMTQQNPNYVNQTQPVKTLPPINQTGIIFPPGNLTQTLQNNTIPFNQNYTQPFNVTSEAQILKELKSLGGNFTNSTH
ncbi:MAG TPA: hypothetical protein VFA69_10165 [Candidatus Nitrosotalea sp.]|jgi:hypothetical protein|nr:hypothetical protein [Candidatus Nitrosotalea sp.]